MQCVLMSRIAEDALVHTFRAREALLTTGWSTAMMGDFPLTDDERYAAAVDIARDLSLAHTFERA